MFGSKFESKPLEHIPDPNTGEMIHRYSTPPEIVKDIEKSINIHSQTMNQFVQNAVTYFDILDVQIDLKRKVKTADENVKVALNKAMKDCKLDPKLPFAWNILLKTFEYRSPPTVEGMSPEELKASNNPTNKPDVIDAGGVGVS